MGSIRVVTNTIFRYRELPVDCSAISAVIDPDRPWLAEVVEKLPTDAPKSAKPWCCYSQTVIFYEAPWREVGGNFAEHDQLETVLHSEDIIEIDGSNFELLGRSVLWRKDDGWTMQGKARRIKRPTPTEQGGE